MKGVPKSLYRIAYGTGPLSFLSQDFNDDYTNKKDAVTAAADANRKTDSKLYRVVTYRLEKAKGDRV